jgi:8-oxo-dGTP diphosphatase
VTPARRVGRHPSFAVTVDVAVFVVTDAVLRILLVQRARAPFRGAWALPGGFKEPAETLDAAARRELREETGVRPTSTPTQLGAYGDPGRDPRGNVVTVAYVAPLRRAPALRAASDAARAALVPVDDVVCGRVELAFDHGRIVADALEYLRRALEVDGLAPRFLPARFTLGALRDVYQAVWGVPLDPARFRRRVLAGGAWLVATGARAPGRDRSSALYRAGPGWRDGGPMARPAGRRRASGRATAPS